MNGLPLPVIDISKQTDAVTTNYANFSLASVNDHVVKVSVMTQSYYWHYHPNSDETFLAMEGILLIDLESETIELLPGQLVTIPRNVVHRTRPKGERSVNITIEHSQLETVKIDPVV
ncbi:cupin domain-containing protein [Spirosoma sp. BT702]|uniref:Cupin domain-containing protein n=1 Tax=Spirosoma profusum TaxID=2771354 RepID=A0A927AWH8_9BACT|nr:cupin domain-containing protein [Spirosoma profusum]MBD2705753.1 cupin domain-containing protein [Spirosoma profusum]